MGVHELPEITDYEAKYILGVLMQERNEPRYASVLHNEIVAKLGYELFESFAEWLSDYDATALRQEAYAEWKRATV